LNRITLPLYGLTFLSGVVWLAIVPLTPSYTRLLSLSKVEVGMVLASAGLTTLAMSFPIGVLADRVGTKTLTVGSGIVVALSCVGQGLAPDFATLLVSRAAFGVALGTIWTAGIAWISDASTDYERSSALGLPTTVSGLGIMVGPGFAGLSAGAFGVRAPFLVLAVAALVTTAALARAPRLETTYRTESIAATLRGARRNRFVVASCAVMVLVGLVNGGINLLAPLELGRRGFSAGETGIVFSAASAIFVVVSAKVTRYGGRVVSTRVAGGAALLYALTLLIVVTSGAGAAIVVFLLARAPFWSTLSTLSYPLGAAGAHDEDLGRGVVMGLLNLVWGAASSVGPLAAGGLAQGVGERWVWVALCACCLAVAAFLLGEPRRPRLAPGTEPSVVRP